MRNIKFNKLKFWYVYKTFLLPTFPILINNNTFHPFGSGKIPWKPLYFLWISPSQIINQKILSLLSLNTIWRLLIYYSSATNLVPFLTVKLIFIQYFSSIQSTQEEKLTFLKYKPFHIIHLISILHWAFYTPRSKYLTMTYKSLKDLP